MNVKEAIQWVNIAFMSVCRVINGAATSLGRVPIVLDIFAERDLARGTFTESEIQEFVDDFVMKLRTVKFARTKAYDQLYSGDPTFIPQLLWLVWVTTVVTVLLRWTTVS